MIISYKEWPVENSLPMKYNSTTAQRAIIRKHITVCFLKDEYLRISNCKNTSKKCIR